MKSNNSPLTYPKNPTFSSGKWQEVFKIPNPIFVETLELTENCLTPADFSTLPSLSRLQKLDLSDNLLDNSVSFTSLFEKFPQLRILLIKQNKLRNELKISISGAGGNIFTASKYIPLQNLDISNNKIKTIIFETEFPLLQVLNVSYNILDCISGLEKIKAIINLNISHNKLTFLPHEMASLQMLQELDASFNQIERFFDNFGLFLVGSNLVD